MFVLNSSYCLVHPSRKQYLVEYLVNFGFGLVEVGNLKHCMSVIVTCKWEYSDPFPPQVNTPFSEGSDPTKTASVERLSS